MDAPASMDMHYVNIVTLNNEHKMAKVHLYMGEYMVE